MTTAVRTLTQDDIPLMRCLLNTFGTVFGQEHVYSAHQPDDDYLRRLLHFDIALEPNGND